MAFNIQAGGPQTILNSSSTGPGNWYRVHPQIRNITFQATINGSSLAATGSSSAYIQVSNDGVNPLASIPIIIGITGAAPLADGATMDAHYEYVRAQINSITSGAASLTVVASAQIGRQ